MSATSGCSAPRLCSVSSAISHGDVNPCTTPARERSDDRTQCLVEGDEREFDVATPSRQLGQVVVHQPHLVVLRPEPSHKDRAGPFEVRLGRWEVALIHLQQTHVLQHLGRLAVIGAERLLQNAMCLRVELLRCGNIRLLAAPTHPPTHPHIHTDTHTHTHTFTHKVKQRQEHRGQ
jgi:hypothetical protein